jgi:glycosyltransferase involved in cell wall biosynthesis
MVQQAEKHLSVGVVIPVYNVAEYIERSVRSVMRQVYPAVECYIVDDASTDDSVELCNRLIESYDGPTRFTILHHDSHRGVSAARNTGTDAVRADYIYYLDSDDEMTPDCLEQLVRPALADNSLEMVLGDFMIDREDGSGGHSVKRSNSMLNTPDALHSREEIRAWFYARGMERSANLWNKLLKMSFIKDNRLYCREGVIYEDQLWSFYMMRCISSAAFVKEITYIYYRRPYSIMTGTASADKRRFIGEVFKEVADNLIPGKYVEEAVILSRFFCRFAIDAPDDVRFSSAYEGFCRELSDGRHCFALMRLKLMRRLSKNTSGRKIFRFFCKISDRMLILRRIVLKRVGRNRLIDWSPSL